LFYVDELQGLQEQLPDLTFTVCVWRPADGWRAGFRGTPAAALQEYLLKQPDNYDIYLCGPPLLVAAATQAATAQGISEQQIFSEKFG